MRHAPDLGQQEPSCNAARVGALAQLAFAIVMSSAVATVFAQSGVDLRVLDGMSFAGTFGPAGGDGRDEDTFMFKDGMFTSTGCIDYGFAPRPYWVRQEADGVHFLAEMESPEHGRIVYTGRIHGNRMDASYVWTKERWYWSVKREFWFKGELMQGD